MLELNNVLFAIKRSFLALSSFSIRVFTKESNKTLSISSMIHNAKNLTCRFGKNWTCPVSIMC